MTDFESATYYDCRNSESLQHESVEEAIEELLDLLATPVCDMRALIKEHAPITVTAYIREQVSDKFIERVASDLLEQASERFSEEFGDPDGYRDGLDDLKVTQEVGPLFVEAVKRLYAHGTVWQCRRAGKREYSAEEVEEMMYEQNPEWFDAS